MKKITANRDLLDETALTELLEGLARAADCDKPTEGRALAVLAVLIYLRRGIFDPRLLNPLDDAVEALINAHLLAEKGNRPGPKPRPYNAQTTLGQACAFVTVLSRRQGWTLVTALKRVGDDLSIDQRRLRTIRDNILRGVANGIICDAYHDALDDLNNKISEEEHLMALQVLKFPGFF